MVCCDLERLNYRNYLEILYAMVDDKSFFRCVNYKYVIEEGTKVKFRRGYLKHVTEILKKRYNYQDGFLCFFLCGWFRFP